MKTFSFNHHQYNLWPIYEVIQKYYPIGVPKNEAKLYFDFPGIKAIEKLLVEQIHQQENFEKTWLSFCGQIEEETGFPLVGTTMGQAPSFSAYLVIEEEQYPNLIYTKELHFAISLLGPFYQIYGVDYIQIIEPNLSAPRIANVITPSPLGAYEKVFIHLEKMIQKKYPTYRLIPFFIGQQYVPKLQVVYSDDELCSVNQALFNDFLISCQSAFLRQGKQYGLAQWSNGVDPSTDVDGLIF